MNIKIQYQTLLLITFLWLTNTTFALNLSSTASENIKKGKQIIKPEPFPGEPINFQGFALFTIPVGTDNATVLCPANPAQGRPWVLAPSSYDLKSAPVAYIAQTELELAKRGFYVVTLNLGNTYGAPDAIAKWDALYPLMTKKYGMAKKPALMGLSREGLAIARWAAANKGKVSCLYMDKAVCDFKSWPGGKLGIGKGSRGDWQNRRGAEPAVTVGQSNFNARNFSNPAIDSQFGGAPVHLPRPLPASGLPHHIVFLYSAYNCPAILNGSGKWFFTINIEFLIGRSGINKSVPMVGQGNRNGINLLFFQKFAVIAIGAAITVFVYLINYPLGIVCMVGIHIANCNKLHLLRP